MVKRVEKYNRKLISEAMVLGLLKDMILNKKISGIAWPGNYLDEKDKDKAYPIGIQLWVGENAPETKHEGRDMVIQFTTEQGIWEVDNETVKELKEIKLSEATEEQIRLEIEKRKQQKAKK